MPLTLTRMVGQRLMIGDSIVVEVRQIRGKQVALSITAPPDIKILREELAPDDPRRDTEKQ